MSPKIWGGEDTDIDVLQSLCACVHVILWYNDNWRFIHVWQCWWY